MSNLGIRRDRYRLPEGQYVNEAVGKSLIVLHGTGGTTAEGAYQSWRASPERVGTAYLIDRDGTIHETFPPECWAWHLGARDLALEKRSIGIELVNAGPLALAGEELRMWTGRRYCSTQDTPLFVQARHRGHDFYASYTGAQFESTARLTRELCSRFGIPPQFLPAADLAEFCLPAVRRFQGIAGHHNVRRDKWDPGPWFVRAFLDLWQQIAEGSFAETRVL